MASKEKAAELRAQYEALAKIKSTPVAELRALKDSIRYRMRVPGEYRQWSDSL